MKKLAILPLALTLSACTGLGYNPQYRFNWIQVVNLTGDEINDVEVKVLDTSKAVSCERVNNNAVCQDYFPGRNYPRTGVELSWTHTDGSRKSETVNPYVPVTFESVWPLRIVIEVGADGTLNPFYEQDEPGRDGGMFMGSL